MPGRDAVEFRGKSCNQVNTGLDHGGGVQVCRNRSRGSHCAGQPEVEGDIRGLGQRTGQNQTQRHGDIWGLCPAVVVGDFAKLPHASLTAQDDDADQHSQTTSGSDHQRLGGRAARGCALTVVRHQQEGQHRGDFPKDVHQQQGIGDDQAIHRGGKADHFRTEEVQAPGDGIKITPTIN